MTRSNQVRIGVYALLGLAVLTFALHPYTRQTVCGPRIRRIPFAYWQDDFRDEAGPRDGQSVAAGIAALIGVERREAPFPKESDLLPVVVSLRDDADDRVREHVARHLGLHADSDEAFDALRELIDDPSPAVRRTAAYAVASFGPKNRAIEPKLRALLADPSAECRLHAAYAICSATALSDTDAVHEIRIALRSTDQRLHRKALELLGTLAQKNTHFIEFVAEEINKARDDPKLLIQLILSLHDAGPASIPPLVDLLKHADARVRGAAALLLEDLGARAESATPALVEALADPDPGVRNTVRSTLSRIDPKRYPPGKRRK